tara:strand:+ start:13057 stop:13704 length:648 start_codon:yes stop_codon:yes gene_type:complete
MLTRFIALVLIVALMPAFFMIFLGCLIFQGTPIIYSQDRIGLNFKKFKIYKFRSMKINTSNDKITSHNDSRITRWGKTIRFMKLDELPQLFNILKGEMVFVGPRPEVPEYVDFDTFNFLNNLKPGLSDYASIIFRNEAEILSKIGGREPYLELIPIKCLIVDYYIRNKKILTDFKIVIITIISIFAPWYTNEFQFFEKIKSDQPKLNEFFTKYTR